MAYDMIGNFNHTIDSKNRLFIPAKQRENLGNKVYMTRGLDDCIFVFSEQQWDNFVAGLEKLSIAKSRTAVRYFAGNASSSDVDTQGRIVIPNNLRQVTGIDKDVTVVGVIGRLELWVPEKWESFNAAGESNAVSDILEELEF